MGPCLCGYSFHPYEEENWRLFKEVWLVSRCHQCNFYDGEKAPLFTKVLSGKIIILYHLFIACMIRDNWASKVFQYMFCFSIIFLEQFNTLLISIKRWQERFGWILIKISFLTAGKWTFYSIWFWFFFSILCLLLLLLFSLQRRKYLMNIKKNYLCEWLQLYNIHISFICNRN